jgi:flagellar basal body-associated protein FliL
MYICYHKKTQTEKPNELLINYISMLDPDLIPLDLISGLYDNDKTQYEAMLNSLVSFSLVQIVEQENCIRLSRKTSQEMLDWMRRRYAKRINKIYENLVNVLDVLFTEKITQESCLYYPSLVYLFSLDFKYKLTKKRSKDSEYNLYYKMALFCLNYMRDPQNALVYLETGINFDNDDEFIAPKSLMGKIYLLKGVYFYY